VYKTPSTPTNGLQAQTLRSEVFFRLEIDEPVLPVYKTLSTPTNDLQATADISNKPLTQNMETIKHTIKHVDTSKEQKDITDKLTSLIPSSCYISNPFKGAKSKTSTPFTGTLGVLIFRTCPHHNYKPQLWTGWPAPCE
jgi:hypothetical protein